MAFAIRDWRYLHIAVSSPLLLAPLLYFILPESIMWLMSKGKGKYGTFYSQVRMLNHFQVSVRKRVMVSYASRAATNGL